LAQYEIKGKTKQKVIIQPISYYEPMVFNHISIMLPLSNCTLFQFPSTLNRL